MSLKIQELSSVYQVKKLTQKDIPSILELEKNNLFYYECMASYVTKESILKEMKDLPPKATLKDKFYIGFYQEQQLIAVLDLIFNYPTLNAVFINFFMVHPQYQKKGIASQIIQEILSHIPEPYSEMHLGITSKNEIAQKFWKKNGFKPTGKEYHQPLYTVQMMSRKLSD